ncbi:hypothetical protein CVT25_003771 [Psilocybe cyanescens]|uniref:CHAT domain-containing protein n=1 Tax=Psilocybe cyanescens TaxID=93625 RepID=A0A409XKS8_PSICY|nr:hypothetical protein CVT25_003771 [Psilocybe cyanescens]
MDTIILHNLRITPNPPGNDTLPRNARLSAQLIIEDVVHDETEPVEEESDAWILGEAFLISVIYPAFIIGIVQVDENGAKIYHGTIEIVTEQIQTPASQRETYFVVQTSTEDDRDFFLELSFTGYLTTSNINKGPSPSTVISVARSMELEAIIVLLIQILISDTAFMSPDQGLLSTIHGALLKFPQDDIQIPRSLGLLANIHLARYDAFLKMTGDDADKYPMYPVYHSGINMATSMLEKTLTLAAIDHPKKQWMMISLCTCYQRRMVQEIAKPLIFRNVALKMLKVACNIDDCEKQKPILSNYLGVALENCFERNDSRADLDFSIAAHEDAVRLTSDDAPHKLSFLTGLMASLSARVDLHGAAEDTRRLLDVKRETLRLTPDDNPAKPGLLMSLGHSFFLQFKEGGNQSDVNDSVRLYEQALELVSETDPLKPSILNNLAASLSTRGTAADFSRETQLIYEAVGLTPHADPEKVQFLRNLGNSIRSHIRRGGWNAVEFQKYAEAVQSSIPSLSVGDDLDILVQDFNIFIKLDMKELSTPIILDEILPHFASTITAIPDSCLSKPLVLFDFGSLLYRIFEKCKERQLVDQSVLFLEQSVTLSSSSPSKNALWINNLALVYLSRYVHFNALPDLEKAMDLSTTTSNLLSNDHKDRPFFLRTISNSHLQRFLKEGNMQHLDQAIEIYRDALATLPESIPQRFGWLKELGSAYLRRFEELSEPGDIDKAIQTLEEGLKGLHNEPTSKDECILNLARSMFFRFNQSCQMGDLYRAVAYLEIPSWLSLSGDADLASFITERYDDMLKLFHKFSGMADINACVHEMVVIIGDRETLDETALDAIGTFLSIRLGELQGAIEPTTLDSLEKAVELISDMHPKKGMWLRMLAGVFTQRFDIFRDGENLDKAISLYEEAIRHHGSSSGSSSRLFSLAISLDVSLNRRFYQSGNITDLNKSIGILQDTVAICPDEERTKYLLLHNLGRSLMQRYDLLGDIVDFNKSAIAYQDAMDLSPSDNPDSHTIRANIGNVYSRKFKITGDIDDARHAIDLLKVNMESLSDQDPMKIDALTRYSMAILDRYWHFHNTDDLNEAIVILETLLSQVPEESSRKANILHDLGSALAQRFVQLGELDDINRCLSLYNSARGMMDERDPMKYMLLFDIGRWLPTRYERLHDAKDLDDADKALAEASLIQSSPYRWRFRAASLRGYWCQSTQHGDPIEGYTAVMQLLPNLAWLGISIQNRQYQLFEVGEVVLDAVAAAIKCSRYDLALGWLEQGRSVTWGQIFELRVPADALLPTYPDIARKFTEVSTALSNMESNHDNDRHKSPSYVYEENLKQSGSQLYHELADERDKLLKQIRALDGFQDFLKPKDKASLQRASAKGPVVAVNIDKFGCDALVLLADRERVLHIPLTDFSASEAYDLMKNLKRLLRSATRMRGNTRAPRRSPLSRRVSQNPENAFQDILAKLWTGVAKPILDGIGFTSPYPEDSHPPHIWWCLTGPATMLPIHAAGLYGIDDPSQTRSKLSDYVVSSYIPSLTALINCMEPRRIRKSNLVAISLPMESGLPFTQAEIEAIRKYNASFPVSTLIESEATLENVLLQMQSAGWVHFACHGVQNVDNPNLSALMLSGGAKLTLSDISKLSLPHAELAFLSACQTATGDELLPEEAIHLAAGMLAAGYQGVVGTMWSTFDDDGPKIADIFYSRLFKNPTPDPADAAYALHAAVKALREDRSQKVSFFAWVPFVHYGL